MTDKKLTPAVIQDALTGRVLMLGWMDDEALAKTRETGEVHFWSRSRQRLWKKGETSGHVLKLVEIKADCDADTFFPEFNRDAWLETASERHAADEKNEYPFTFVVLVKKRAG